MKVKGLNGREYNLKIADYLIDWHPKREVSKPQARVKAFLYPYWKTSVCTEELRVPGTLMRIDLANWTRRVIVEVSPQSSHSFNAFFHKSRHGFGAAVKRDLDKAEWAELNGFTYCELDELDIEQLSAKWWEKTFGIPL